MRGLYTISVGDFKRSRLGDLDVDRKYQNTQSETGYEAVDWIHMTYDRVQWWGIMNTTMNLQFKLKPIFFNYLNKHQLLERILYQIIA
jgi:hypothetical protein